MKRALRCLALAVPLSLLACGHPPAKPATPPEQAQFQAGQQQLASGDAKGAAGSFETAIRLNGRFAPAYFALASVQARTGDLPKAIATLESLRRAAPDTPHIACRLAELRSATGSFVQAAESAKIALEAEPTCPDALTQHALVLVAAGQPADAITELRRAAQQNPGSPRVAAALAQLLARQGHADEAWKVLDAIPQSQETVSIDYVKGWLLAEYGIEGKRDDTAALKALDMALARDPGNGPANLEKGRILLRRGDAKAAAPLLDRALRAGDPSVDLLNAAADVREKLHDPSAAQIRKDATAFAVYADRLYRARQQYLRGDRDPKSLIALARLEAAMGHTTDAHDLLMTALQQDPNNAEALRMLTPGGPGAGQPSPVPPARKP